MNLQFQEELEIRSTPESIWQAIVQPEIVEHYHLAPLRQIDLKPGGTVIYGTESEVLLSGEVVEWEENTRLVHSFRFGPQRHPGVEGDPDTLVSYEIRNEGGACFLKLTHSGFTEENQTYANITGGWPHILARMKKYLERP